MQHMMCDEQFIDLKRQPMSVPVLIFVSSSSIAKTGLTLSRDPIASFVCKI
jgi:hypothetical protein